VGSSFSIMTKEELVCGAKELSQKAPEPFSDCVKLYFYARYLVSVFEARNFQLPIQVWNEYRNALDHFMRYMTTVQSIDEDLNSPQVKAMRGHLQRAVLDISKFICHCNADKIVEFLAGNDVQVLALVDNGNFLTEAKRLEKKAESDFIEAKVEDKILGDDRGHNEQVVEKYLSAVYSYEDACLFLENKQNDIVNAYQRHGSLLNKGKNLSRKEQIFIALAIGFVFYVLGNLLPFNGDSTKPQGVVQPQGVVTAQ